MKLQKIITKLAKPYGRKLTASEYISVLTKAHNILYGNNKEVIRKNDSISHHDIK